ncbi:MAG: cyclic nucleotide-binding domain-containing protein [Deltaproteobacteria bacterium]|nr:cyclic nucleotide-binding domain-containing protein [Deltaproteobacteria bacterium]
MNGKIVFSGYLEFMGLADIFQMLGNNRNTGVLQLTNDYLPNRGQIFFKDGNPINAISGHLRGLNAIYSLFGWNDGKYEFLEKPIQVEQVVKHSRMQIVMDAMRMVDEGKIKRIGSGGDKQPGKGKAMSSNNKKGGLSVVKGPQIDYTYIIEENLFRNGERIVKEGHYGNWIWVILSGLVEVSRETPKGPLPVARIGEGCFIGTIASLVFREYARTATATAVGDVHLGLLDIQQLAGEYSCLSTDFKKLLLSLCGRLNKLNDSSVGLSMREIKENAAALMKDKKMLLNKEKSVDDLFLITAGEIYVVGQTPKGYLPLATLNRNDVFGSVPFIDMGHDPQYTAVIASKDVKVDKINKDNIKREYDHLTPTFKNLVENVGSCVSMTTKIACQVH